MLEKPESLEVKEVSNNERLDKFLSSYITDYSRSFLQKLIKNELIKVNGNVVKSPKTTVHVKDIVEINWPNEGEYESLIAENFNFDVLFEDNDLLVINKPAGIVVHPAAGNRTGTVVNALLGKDLTFADGFKEDDISASQRPGIVHRLDKETSGCLIIAKNAFAKNKLTNSFAERKIKKTYYVLVSGFPQKEKNRIVSLIGRHPVNRKKMAIVERNGKEAITIYELIKKGMIEKSKVSLLKVNILTGRTHQIRVHLASEKIPVLGDKVYGGHQKLKVARQMLHAGEIIFPHPRSGRDISITTQYPEDFQTFVSQL